MSAADGLTRPLYIRAGQAVDASRVWGPSEVRITDGRIDRIQPWRPGVDAEPTDGVVLGGLDYLLMPGWVNAHTHLSLTLLAGAGADRPLEAWLHEAIWPAEARMTEEDVEVGARMAMAQSLLSGTTTVHDMYFHEAAVVRAASAMGIRGVFAVGLAGEGEAFHTKLAQAVDLARSVHAAGDARIRMRLGPHAVYTCPPASLAAVREAAVAEGLGIHIHLAETRHEVDACVQTYGLSPIALCAAQGLFDVPCMAAHVVWPSDADMETLARHDVAVAHCPTSNLWLGSGIAPVRRMRSAGVRIALGSDSAASSPGLDMTEVARLAWLLAKGVGEDPAWPTAREVFAWGTVEGAAALGLSDVGRLAAGQRADLVLLRTGRAERAPLSGDPYLDAIGLLAARDVDTVLVDGVVRVQGGRLVDIDLPALAEDVRARSHRLRPS